MNDFNYLNIYRKDDKILLVGVYPPPLGGVSVHIYRLLKLLKKNKFNINLFDTSKHSLFSGIKLIKER